MSMFQLVADDGGIFLLVLMIVCFVKMQAEDDIDDKKMTIPATKETEPLNTSQRTAMVLSLALLGDKFGSISRFNGDTNRCFLE